MAPGSGSVLNGMKDYLALTDAQAAVIAGILNDFNDYAERTRSQIAALQQDILNLRGKETLDTTAIGADYVAIEVALRSTTTQWTTAQNRIQQVLTPEQQTKLQPLQDSVKMQPLVDSARCSGMIN
jgi:Spy/CpxP family protein refolding chaperone